MCVAIPGKVVEIEGNQAIIDVMNNRCKVDIRLVSPQIGDYVLVHAGCAIEVLSQDMALEMLEIFEEL